MAKTFFVISAIVAMVGIFTINIQPVSSASCDFQADFSNPGQSVSGSGRGVSWKVPFAATTPCDGQGVLQLTPPAGTTTLTIDMMLTEPKLWTFNVGDSPSNNGYGGDSGHTWNAAEIHNIGSTTFLYRAFSGTNRPNLQASMIRDSVRTGRYTITIKKPVTGQGVSTRCYVGANNYHGVDVDFTDPLLFVWDTMYMGINQVVNGGRYGTGLCSVCISWA